MERTCIISPHEKGFYTADFYENGWFEDAVPDGYISGSIGQARDEFEQIIAARKPDYKIVPGITGYCDFCQTEHFEIETDCVECGEHVEQQ